MAIQAEPEDLHELEVQRALRWLDLEFSSLRGGDGLDAVTRQLRERMAQQAVEALPFEPFSHALGRWLNGDDIDKRWCAVGLVAALGLKEHLPALRSLRREAEGGGEPAPQAWVRQLDAALHTLAPRERDA